MRCKAPRYAVRGRAFGFAAESLARPDTWHGLTRSGARDRAVSGGERSATARASCVGLLRGMSRKVLKQFKFV